jgi:hypothetical protein
VRPVDGLTAELGAIADEADLRGIPFVVVGAFAVRAYLRAPDRRRTADLDLVIPAASLDSMRSLLEARGYNLFRMGPWWRAQRGSGADKQVVDFCADAVVDLSSFASYPLDPADSQRKAEPGGRLLPVPPLEDVLALKLLAQREKDQVDVVALMLDAGSELDAKRFWSHVEERDLEIAVRRGWLELAATIEAGAFQQLWQERLGEPLPPGQLDRALTALQDLFA